MKKKLYEKPQISREQLERELLETTERFWMANQKLQEEERRRTEFLSNLSHDLRSPLTALSSSVEYLKTGNVSKEEEGEVLELMQRRLHSMQTLINDIFLLTKVETSSLTLQMEKVDAGFFLEEFFYDCEADPKYEDRDLILDISDNLQGSINVDPEQMIRVLDNLFTNAKKYSEPGASITLRAFVQDVEETENGQALVIEVEDTGIGMEPEHLEHIFERSYRVSKSRTVGDSSSGLGLAIAKGIVEKHSGTISCESTFGVGSKFIVKLPLWDRE